MDPSGPPPLLLPLLPLLPPLELPLEPSVPPSVALFLVLPPHAIAKTDAATKEPQSRRAFFMGTPEGTQLDVAQQPCVHSQQGSSQSSGKSSQSALTCPLQEAGNGLHVMPLHAELPAQTDSPQQL
jgi:hypothetical protein